MFVKPRRGERAVEYPVHPRREGPPEQEPVRERGEEEGDDAKRDDPRVDEGLRSCSHLLTIET